jgi:rfaE bifunctional protein nucleotidyltransferase chain/domain
MTMRAQDDKVLRWDQLMALRARWRAAGKTVVWTNGCFDLLHVGHLRGLQAARALGDVLVVGLNGDRSVRGLKGPGRPILPAAERAELLAALGCVDCVTVFDELTPERVLAELQPDIHTKGSDYAPPHGRPVPEAAVVAAYGGQIRFLDFVAGRSTSALLQQIRDQRGT